VPVGLVLGRAGGRRREGRKRRKEEKKKERRKKKKRKGRKEKERKERGGKIRKEKKENREGFLENLGKFLGRLGKVLRGFFPVFGCQRVFSGTAVMARRTGHRVRGVRGIPGRWPTAALGRRAGVRPRCGAGGICGTRAGERGREREREQWLGFEW
jgi:hypothetical protein